MMNLATEQIALRRGTHSSMATNHFYWIVMWLQRALSLGFITSLWHGSVKYFFCVYATIFFKIRFPHMFVLIFYSEEYCSEHLPKSFLLFFCLFVLRQGISM